MSTRAFVGIDNGNGTKTGVYCHMGLDSEQNIIKNFKTQDDIKKLLDYGSISGVFAEKDRNMLESLYGNDDRFAFDNFNENCIVVSYVDDNGKTEESASTMSRNECPFEMCAFELIYEPDEEKWGKKNFC